jgi:hypothetical protein
MYDCPAICCENVELDLKLVPAGHFSVANVFTLPAKKTKAAAIEINNKNNESKFVTWF